MSIQSQGNGVIHIEHTLNRTTSNNQGDIPRIGMRMQLRKDRITISPIFWKRTLGELSVTEKPQPLWTYIQLRSVTEQYVPYIRPQDNGYKTDARNGLPLSDDNKHGVVICIWKDMTTAEDLVRCIWKMKILIRLPVKSIIRPQVTRVSTP